MIHKLLIDHEGSHGPASCRIYPSVNRVIDRSYRKRYLGILKLRKACVYEGSFQKSCSLRVSRPIIITLTPTFFQQAYTVFVQALLLFFRAALLNCIYL